MQKTPILFDQWNIIAKQKEFSAKKISHVELGEIRRYAEGINIGNEISKDGNFLRPCVILKTNTDNGLVLIIPLTTKYHTRLDRHLIPLNKHKQRTGREARAIINQTKLISTKRLSHLVCKEKYSISTIQYIKEKYIFFIQQK